MIRYFIKGIDVVRISDDGSSNFDPTHDSDETRRYEAWLAEGNTPEPWQPET